MQAGDRRAALLGVADELSVELGYVGGDDLPAARSQLRAGEGPMACVLSFEDEQMVAMLRFGLAKVAAALEKQASNGASEMAVGAVLDGAEMMMRGELMRGNAERLPFLMPSFVFLVAVAVADHDRALELSRRTEQLLNGALG